MNIERGKYWDEACNPIVTDRCQCEVVNCWAKDMLRRFPTLNPSPDENGVGWYPDRLNKISVTGAAKVYAMCWLGDVSDSQETRNYTATVIDYCVGVNSVRITLNRECHHYLFLSKLQGVFNNDFFYYKNRPKIDRDLIHNIWFGTSVCSDTFEKRFNHLRYTFSHRNVKLWLSLEPLIGPITNIPYLEKFSQVIVGAETGKNARPCNLDWIRSLRDQCGEAGVPFFVKQVDAKRNRELDGQLHNALAWRT